MGATLSTDETLDALALTVATNAAITAKRDISLVSEVLGASTWLTGPGDDGALVQAPGADLIVCGEAMFPPFVASDPYGAGIAAVLANVNDVAAMGAEPIAIVDTIVGSSEIARAALEGMRFAAELYRVPIVGGHLTVREGPPAVSAFAVGHVRQPLSATRVEAGHDLVVAACTDGRMRADFAFFSSFGERDERLGDDVRLLSALAAHGLARGAKDISMAGLVGSLAMLLEWGAFGVELDIPAVPTPAHVDLPTWFTCFPTYGFLLTCDPSATKACVDAFVEVGLRAARVGAVDRSGLITARLEGRSRALLDVRNTPPTGLRRPD